MMIKDTLLSHLDNLGAEFAARIEATKAQIQTLAFTSAVKEMGNPSIDRLALAVAGGDPEFTVKEVAEMKHVCVRTIQLWMHGTPQKLGYYGYGKHKTIGASHLRAMQDAVDNSPRNQPRAI